MSAQASVTRGHDGIRVLGQDFDVEVAAGIDGLLGIRVIAHPSTTGLAESVRLGSKLVEQLRFTQSGMTVNPASLECFVANSAAPLYREGFKLVLEPGVAAALKAWLPRLAASSVLAAAVARAVEGQLAVRIAAGRGVSHLHSFTSQLAARIVLDGQDVATALALVRESHWAAESDVEFVQAFSCNAVDQLLQTAAREREDGGGSAIASRAAATSADESAGMDWWNTLSATDRQRWMTGAGDSGIVAEAWAAFKKSQQLSAAAALVVTDSDSKSEQAAQAVVASFVSKIDAGEPLLSFLVEPPFKMLVEGDLIHIDAPCLATGSDKAGVMRTTLTASAGVQLREFLNKLSFEAVAGRASSSKH